MEDSKTATLPLRFVQHLERKDRHELVSLGKRRFIEKNQYVFRAGDPSECVCIVEHGYLKLFQPIADGRDMLQFFRAPGDILGLRGSLRTKPQSLRTYSVQACDDVEMVCIPTNEFRSFLEVHSRMALEVAATLAHRLDDACDNFSTLALTHVAARVAHLILYVGQHYGTPDGKGVNLDVPLTQQEIADMVGAARQTVSSILNTLYHDGVISESHKYLRIEDHQQLTKLAMSHASREETGGNAPPHDRRRTPR